jgi:HEAT repeat protein
MVREKFTPRQKSGPPFVFLGWKMNWLHSTIKVVSLVFVISVLLPLGKGQESAKDQRDLEYKQCEEVLRKAGIKLDRKSLVDVVAQIGKQHRLKDIGDCIKDLDSPKFQKREEAVKLILKMGPGALGLLKESRKGAGPEKARRIERCIKGLEEKRIVWITALALLKRDKARDVIPVLWSALENDDYVVYRETEEALTLLIGPTDLPRVLQGAKDKNPRVRSAAVTLFHIYRDSPGKVVPLGLDILRKDEAAAVRLAAVEILFFWFVKENGVIDALIQAIQDGGYPFGKEKGITVGACAARLLGEMGEMRALPALKKASQAGSVEVRCPAIEGLGRFAKREPRLIPELLPLFEKFMEKKEPNAIRRTAVYSLQWLGERGVPLLIKALKEKDTHLRENALEAVRQIGAKSKAAVPEIISILRDPTQTRNVRERAIRALAKIGPAANAALPALRMNFDDLELRVLAELAIESILKKPGR